MGKLVCRSKAEAICGGLTRTRVYHDEWMHFVGPRAHTPHIARKFCYQNFDAFSLQQSQYAWQGAVATVPFLPKEVCHACDVLQF